ncbi:MAG: hypothetical protein Q9226_007707, partial [Calogaya cf. arnoldii]
MEAIGLVASITQLIAITAKSIKYLNSIGEASAERSKLLQEATSLLPLLVSLSGQVEQAKNDGSAVWLNCIRSLAVEHGPLDRLRAAMEELVRILKPKKGFKIVWIVDRAKCEAILAKIERVKSTVALALQGDTFTLARAVKADTASISHNVSAIDQGVSSMTRDLANARVREDLKQRKEVLDWLSPLDFFKTQQDIFDRHEEGTGQWFLESHEFKDWLSGQSRVLYCPGILGAGKTILASVVIHYLRERHEVVAGIFCNFKEKDTQSPENLLAGGCKQIVGHELPGKLLTLYRRHSEKDTRPTWKEVVEIFEATVDKYVNAFLVVDALDECSDLARKLLLKCSEKVPAHVRLLVMTRHHDEITQRFRSSAARLEIRADVSDLKKYITSSFMDNRMMAKARDRTSLQQDICDKVASRSEGMFLAAKLHVDSLSTKTSVTLLKKALDHLSGDINVLYDEALERIATQNQDFCLLAEKALRWVAYTYRPLRVEALLEALTVEPGDEDFDIDAMPDIGQVLDVCAGLLVLDEENGIVRLVHYTAQEYFDTLAHPTSDEAHTFIARSCITYISHDLQYTQFFKYASTFWAQHATSGEDTALRLEIHQFLARGPRVALLKDSAYDSSNYTRPFLKRHHGCGIAAWFGLDDELANLCSEIAISQISRVMGDSFILAVSNGQLKTTEFLLDQGADINSTSKNGVDALFRASSLGYLSIVNVLLARGLDPNRGSTTYNLFPLHVAAMESFEDCLIALLDHGADMNKRDRRGHTALDKAVKYGNLSIINTLLARGMDPNARGIETVAPPIHHAIGYRNMDCLLTLLAHGADINSKDLSGRTLLDKAVNMDDLDLMKVLLAGGVVDQDARNNLGSSAPEAYQESSEFSFTRHGADVNEQDTSGGTPLHWAAARNNLTTATELVKHRAAVDIGTNAAYSVTYIRRSRSPSISSWIRRVHLSALYNIRVDDQVRCTIVAKPLPLRWQDLGEMIGLWRGALNMSVWMNGVTALDIAKLSRHDEMVRLLEPFAAS